MRAKEVPEFCCRIFLVTGPKGGRGGGRERERDLKVGWGWKEMVRRTFYIREKVRVDGVVGCRESPSDNENNNGDDGCRLLRSF